MTLLQLLRSIETRLAPVSGDYALPEAERIIEFFFACSRSELYLDHTKIDMTRERQQSLEKVLSRRWQDEPLAYILNSAFFYHKEFAVTPDVLIPRPDTEILIEEILKYESKDNPAFFLDIGTGSGCIAATLTDHRPPWRGIATDLSRKALAVAKKNCGPAVSLVCIDLVCALKKTNRFDFLVSNPPYIKSGEIPMLQLSVRDYEPHEALDGGQDGLDFYRKLARQTPRLLKTGGRIYCEIGWDQGILVPEIFKAAGWNEVTVVKDYGGRDRVVRAVAGKA